MDNNYGPDLLHGMGLAARIALNGATGLTGPIADFPFQIANLFGANQQLPTQGQNQLMDKYLGTPQTSAEKTAVMGGSIAMGGLDPAMLVAKAGIVNPANFKLFAKTAALPTEAPVAPNLLKSTYEPSSAWLERQVSAGNTTIRTNAPSKEAIPLGNDLYMESSNGFNGALGGSVRVLAKDGEYWKQVGKLSRNSNGAIENIAVSPGYQHQNIGTTMLEQSQKAGLTNPNLNPSDVSIAGAGLINNYRANAYEAAMQNFRQMLPQANLNPYTNLRPAIQNAIPAFIQNSGLFGQR